MARGPKKLTPEERVLWGRIAATTKPLPGRMEDLMSASADVKASGEDAALPRARTPDAGSGLTEGMRAALASAFRHGRIGDSEAARASGHAKTSFFQPIEKPVHRKLARGRLALEARLDLHGLAQEAAHGMLRGFLADARRRGLRHVLVITGKGSSTGSEGVLKRAVPQWLALPDLSPMVSGYEWAARGHGGEGALYIRLKRAKGVKL